MYFENLYFIFFLPICILPWLFLPLNSLIVRNLPILPDNKQSLLFELLIKLSLSLSLFFLLIGLSKPTVPETLAEKTGLGAEIVLLLDRSRSMDQPYGKVDPNRSLIINQRAVSTKSVAARDVLKDFVKNRPTDFFGLINFSSRPIKIFPLTQKHDAIQKAISSSTLGRSLAETDISAVLIDGLNYFQNRHYTASRVLMLISDGGALIDPITRVKIKELANKYRVSMYWIYLRGRGSPGIVNEDMNEDAVGAVPEFFLNQYFKSLGVPYKVYEASDSEQLKMALEEIDKLQKMPTRFIETIPPKSFSHKAFILALILLTPFVFVALFEVSEWVNLKEKN